MCEVDNRSERRRKKSEDLFLLRDTVVHPVPPVPGKDYSNHTKKKNLEGDLEIPQIHI